MDFSLDSDLGLIAEAVAKRCSDFDDDYWTAKDEDHEFPWEFYRAMADDGWVGIAIPTEFGGGGRGIAEAATVLHGIALSGAAMNGCSAVHTTIFGLEPVRKHGNRELCAEMLPRAAAGDLHVAFGVTEADAGTDTARISTRAERTPDGWSISGKKIWSTKGLESDVTLILVRTSEPSDNRFDGLTLFLADLDPEHVSIRPIPKLGRNAVASCEIFYDNLPVPSGRMVGDEGRGFYYLLDGINPERILVAAEAVGIGRAALHKATSYAKERVVFGRTIGANQAIAHPLAESHMKLEAAWQMVMLAAWNYDNKLPCGAEANTAKFLAAEASFEACDRALQTHGGMGYAIEYHIQRYWKEARLMRLAPISQEMILNFISHQELGLPKSY